MIRIQALDVILEQDTLNRMAGEWIPKTPAMRNLSLELLPGLVRLFVEGHLPMLGDRSVTADLSVELRGNELWLKLEKANIPLIPKSTIVGMVASLAKQDALRAEGSSLVLSLDQLFQKYEVETRISSVSVDTGHARLLCLME